MCKSTVEVKSIPALTRTEHVTLNNLLNRSLSIHIYKMKINSIVSNIKIYHIVINVRRKDNICKSLKTGLKTEQVLNKW